MKKCILILLSVFAIKLQAQTVRADSLIAYAKTFSGTRYCYGACTPKKGFDCSGFIYYVFSHFHIEVPRASMDYARAGKKVSVDSCLPGDILIFTGTNAKNRSPGHVGMVVSNDKDGITFIHCSSGKKQNGVTITNYTESAHYRKRLLKVVRLAAVLASNQ